MGRMGPITDSSSSQSRSERADPVRTWLQLVRAPNLLTVPGDPLAGFLLATFGVLRAQAAFAVGASLCLYAAGLLWNDLFDLEEDRRERPWKAFWPPPTKDQTGYQYGVKPGQIITIMGN